MPIVYKDSHKFYDYVKDQKAKKIKEKLTEDADSWLERFRQDVRKDFKEIRATINNYNNVFEEYIKKYQQYRQDPNYKMVKEYLQILGDINYAKSKLLPHANGIVAKFIQRLDKVYLKNMVEIFNKYKYLRDPLKKADSKKLASLVASTSKQLDYDYILLLIDKLQKLALEAGDLETVKKIEQLNREINKIPDKERTF